MRNPGGSKKAAAGDLRSLWILSCEAFSSCFARVVNGERSIDQRRTGILSTNTIDDGVRKGSGKCFGRSFPLRPEMESISSTPRTSKHTAVPPTPPEAGTIRLLGEPKEGLIPRFTRSSIVAALPSRFFSVRGMMQTSLTLKASSLTLKASCITSLLPSLSEIKAMTRTTFAIGFAGKESLPASHRAATERVLSLTPGEAIDADIWSRTSSNGSRTSEGSPLVTTNSPSLTWALFILALLSCGFAEFTNKP